MRSLITILSVVLCILYSSCDPNEDGPKPIADFEVVVSGDAPEAIVTLINKSINSDRCVWSYTNRYSPHVVLGTHETECEPSKQINVANAGPLQIRLTASRGDHISTKCVTVDIPGVNPVRAYTDIEFALYGGHDELGRFYSFSMNRMFMDDDIALDTIGPAIALAFKSTEADMYQFVSPDREEFNISGAQTTKFNNTPSTDQMTVAEFDAMTDDGKLSFLEIDDTNESFGLGSIPGLVFFELPSGRRGVIKTKEINDERLLVDIKLQDYSDNPVFLICF